MLKLAYAESNGAMQYESDQEGTKKLETILLVDDEEVIIEVTRDILEITGYQVLTASTGREAVDRYRMDKDHIDVVILDMMMPGIGGGEVLEELKILNPSIKVILSSGYGLNSEAKKIMSRGVQSFLQKPFRIDQLLKKITDVLSDGDPRRQ
jgi:two-component system cell cycle sensor histidine kinase/response regulator CckA